MKLTYILLALALTLQALPAFAKEIKLDENSKQTYLHSDETGTAWDSCESDENGGKVCVITKPCSYFRRLFNIGVCETVVKTCHLEAEFKAMTCGHVVKRTSNCKKVEDETVCEESQSIQID